MRFRLTCFAAFVLAASLGVANDNRLTYLNDNNPWYPHTGFPKLTTPQWVGEDEVEAVVILAIDDMRDPGKYEGYLRPILQRLKKIDGRAPVSIMTCNVKPDDPQLRSWIDEGLSIEVHTVDHPCPLLKDGNFARAKSTYDRCVDMLAKIPGNKPVAFRMPCCDSLNTVSPRFYSEIFGKRSLDGNFLSLSSSVFNVFTADDKSIPRELILNEAGRERFRKYIPHQSNSPPKYRFNNFIENYPYPYVINRTCWEFPCVVPSDWEAQHLHKPNNPITVEDMKAALDITVHKQGVYCLVFHPHGWIRNDQVVDIIDHAVAQHGKKVKFLNFREAQQRLNEHLLDGEPLRNSQGNDNGVRLADIDDDGFLDVVTGNARKQQTRIWRPRSRSFDVVPSGVRFDTRQRPITNDWFSDSPLVSMPDWGGLKLGSIRPLNGFASGGIPPLYAAMRLHEGKWVDDAPLAQLYADVIKVGTKTPQGPLASLLFHQTSADGASLAIVTWGETGIAAFSTSVFHWNAKPGQWDKLRTDIPSEVSEALVELSRPWLRFSSDTGKRVELNQPSQPRLRFVDVDEDGDDDFLLSPKPDANGKVGQLKLWLVDWFATGKCVPVILPDGLKTMPIVRADGSDNGFFVRDRHLYWQNEFTDKLPNLLHRVSFDDLLHDHITNQAKGGEYPPPRTPEKSLALIQTRPGLRVELVAAEPLIRDPAAFDWDVTGRLWVVEMGGYPNGIDDKGKGGGRVRILTDTDNDGRMDKAVTFLDGLNFPTGIQLWRKGALITAAPEIFYAEDSDGDGKADVRKTLYRGFVEGNQQHRVNGLRYGLDNWLYVANGDSGGTIVTDQILAPQSTVFTRYGTRQKAQISGRDLRLRPDWALMDVQSGQTQFGRNRDDWGNWFGCNNSHPMWHYTLADHYLRRNPHVSVKTARHEVPVVPGPAPVFPISRTLPRYNDFNNVNRFTSACSTMIYRDQLLGDEFHGNAFTAEPVHNLISRLVVKPSGTTFTGQRAAGEQQSEFLASRDNWFRPTMIRTGPDGALWFADMYRAVIEHPKWIPPEWQEKIDLRGGDQLGRIYRVVPIHPVECCGPVATQDGADSLPNRDGNVAADKLRCYVDMPAERIPTGKLVSRLASPNGWWRDMAQRILSHRQDSSAIKALREMAHAHTSPLARLHALCTLDGLLALDVDDLITSLKDDHPSIRRHAVRLVADTRLIPKKDPDKAEEQWKRLDAALLKRAKDNDPFVRLQLAYSLPSIRNQEFRSRAMSTLLENDRTDSNLVAAVFSSLQPEDFSHLFREINVAELMRKGDLFSRLIGQAAAFGQLDSLGDSLGKLLPRMERPDQPKERQLRPTGKELSAEQWQRLSSVIRELRRDVPTWLAASKSKSFNYRWVESVSASIQVVEDTSANSDVRAAAIDFLALGDVKLPRVREMLSGLITPQTPIRLQIASVNAVAAMRTDAAIDELFADWKQHSPSVRASILDAAIEHGFTGRIVHHLEKRTIAAGDIDALRRERLRTSGDADVKKQAAKLLALSTTSQARREVIESFNDAQHLTGDMQRGRVVFEKKCAACHKLQSIGKSIGADLSSLRDKSTGALLTAILDPNRAVEAKFLSFTVVTTQGRSYSGMLLAETGNSITLVSTDGKEHVINRQELDELVGSNRSLMPEGFERDLSKQDISDVIAFVQSAGTPPKKFAGNGSRTITADANNVLVLPASAAEIHGPSIVFEQKFKNLGYWSSADDRARWTINVTKAGKYSIELDYAVHANAAGDELQLVVAGQTLRGKVTSTDTWEDYRTWKLGSVKLPLGQSQVFVSSVGKPRSAMIDLRNVTLRLLAN